MRRWPVQDAKARFSELLYTCIEEGPQYVTRRGTVTAVLVPIDQWRRVQQSAPLTLKERLLGDGPRFELELPPRGHRTRRRPAALE